MFVKPVKVITDDFKDIAGAPYGDVWKYQRKITSQALRSENWLIESHNYNFHQGQYMLSFYLFNPLRCRFIRGNF